MHRGGEDAGRRPQSQPANPSYNPWAIDTHRVGYLPNVEDYAEWEREHRHDEADDEDHIWVKPHDRKRKSKK